MHKFFSFKPVLCSLFLFTGILLFSSCSSNRLDIDVSAIDANIRVKRFEQDLFQNDPEKIDAAIPILHNDYQEFLNLFSKLVISIGSVDNPSYSTNLKSFITDYDMKKVFEESRKTYPDFGKFEEMLEDAFRHYKYYFPDKSVPEIITIISGFNYNIVAAEKTLAIGLDMYLGSNYEYYRMLGLPKYKTENMKAENIVPDCMKGWASSEYMLDSKSENTLLSRMIYHGKILYFSDAMLPETEDHLKIGYTQDQITWCRKNESQIWSFLIDRKLLYLTDHKEIIKYIEEAPFTQGFPEGSPGRTGIWIGWQIVRAYMNNNSAISLRALMEDKNAQHILAKSRYKPKL